MFRERIEGYVRGVQGGIFAPNEVRELEGYAPVEAGDEPRMQQQMMPLSWEPPAAAPQPPQPPPQDQQNGPQLNPDEQAALAMIHLQREMNHVRTAA